MNITIHPDFKKAYKKRISNNPKLVAKTAERLRLFQENPRNPLLRDHKLKGDKKDFRGFWITGDIRIVYFPVSDNEVLLLSVGTHNQVY